MAAAKSAKGAENHSLAEGSASPLSPVRRMGLSLKKYTKAAASASAATVSAVPRECSIRVAIAAFIYS